MKKPLLPCLLVLVAIATLILRPVAAKMNPGANTGADEKLDISGFHGTVIPDVVYGHNINYLGADQQLAFDVYLPGEKNPGAKSPLFFWVHGGGFTKGKKEGSAAFMKATAARGFVVVSLEYRLGFEHPNPQAIGANFGMAVYRAIQDGHAALRYLVAHADEYGIDPNAIFVGGGSAGAVTALSLAFVQPEEAVASLPGVEKKLGPLMGGTNSLTDAYKIRGVVAMWGAIGSASEITKADAVPVIFFHGLKDHVAPPFTGPAYTNPAFPVSDGTVPLYHRLRELGVPAQAYLDPEGGHGVFSAPFRTEKMVAFMKAVLAGDATSGIWVGDGEHFEPYQDK